MVSPPIGPSKAALEVSPVRRCWKNQNAKTVPTRRVAVMMRLSPIKVLQARAETRAYLYFAGQFDFETAIEPLYIYAIETGLSLSLAREIIRAAFDVFDDELVS